MSIEKVLTNAHLSALCACTQHSNQWIVVTAGDIILEHLKCVFCFYDFQCYYLSTKDTETCPGIFYAVAICHFATVIYNVLYTHTHGVHNMIAPIIRENIQIICVLWLLYAVDLVDGLLYFYSRYII